MKRIFFVYLLGIAIVGAGLSNCKKGNEGPSTGTTTSGGSTTSTTSSSTTGTTSASSDVPEVYKKIYGSSSISVDGNYIVIKSKGRPDHKSAYYKGTQWESSLYESYTASGFIQNPNKIAEQNLTFRIPKNPVVASTHSATPYGPIGIAVNGVAIYNQYAAPGDDLSNEMKTFDQYSGHPQMQGQYHYHTEPSYLTLTKGSDALIGFLLDGFPVYGPKENGKTISNSDLDSYHGHTSATADYPSGVYHYHITSTDPYINGSGFYGTAGTVSQ